MPGKGSKSPRNKSPKNAKADTGIAWESILTTSSINQDNWTTFVCFLTPDCAINQIYVDLIEKAMQHNIRRRFDVISKRDFIEAIRKVEKQTKNAAKSVSTNSFVDSLNNSTFVSAYEHAKTLLEAGSDIDDQLWAKLIKCRILDLKKEVQTRTITKTGGGQAAAAPAKPEKGKGGKKSPKAAAAAKKQAAAAAPPPVSDTHIEKPPGVKTRDQITDETKYVDDEPNDGPNQYIYLSGFYSIGLLHALDDVGIRIDTITDVSCDNLDETKQLFDEMIRRDRQEQTLKSDVLKEIPTPEQITEQNQRNDQVINHFWTSLMPILDNAPDQSMLQDVIVTTLKVPHEELPDSWINSDQKFRLADSLCDNIVDNSFRLNIRKRQFKTFNQQMKVVPIPVIEEKIAKSTSDAKIYTEMTTVIPPESISVPLILHGILEQVEAKLANPNSNNSNLSNENNDVGQYLRDKLMSLSMGKQQQKETEKLVPKSPYTKTTGSGPTMVYYGDEIKQRLITLNRLAILDPIKIERDSLVNHSSLVNLPELSRKKSHDPDEKERQTRLNQFLQFCIADDLLPTDVDHILKQFTFECISLNPMIENTNEQQTSRPSSAASSNQDDEQFNFENRLTNLNDEEKKLSSNFQPIVWDDPYELLRTNQETGRIGLSTRTRSSSTSSHSSAGSTQRSDNQSSRQPDKDLSQQLPHILPPVGDVHVDGTIQAVLQHHKRNLNDWNFAEHFEPEIFLQVIEQALFTHSHVDIYFNRRDQTHMMVLSLPIPTDKTIGYKTTSKKLFSDVGFRNFLDEISYEIVDWLRDEEAKYQADVLAQEVQTYVRQTTPTPDATKGAGAGKKGKAAGKKTPPARSRSTSVSSEAGNTTAEDEQTIRDDYAHPTSLKVWKQKRDKEIQEEELAKAKRAESATKRGKTKTPRASEKAQEKSSKDNKLKQQASSVSIEKPPETQPPPPPIDEPVEQFTGYSLGNHLLSAQCSTTHLLLPDGCFVRTRVDSLKRGSTCVSASLYRNKSSYMVQLINPIKSANNNNSSNNDNNQQQPESSTHTSTDESSKSKDDNSISEKRVAQYGVFTALLNSGMIVSCSNYDMKAPKVEAPAPPPPPPPAASVEHVNSETTDEKKKDAHTTKGKKKVKPVEVEAPPVEKPPPEPQYDPEPFQRLTISIPTGLVVTYYPETFLGVKPTHAKQLHRLVVKQYYACQSKGFHTCEQSRLNAYEESSRIIDGEGHVMIFKRNGELIILQPDGGIFTKTIVYPNEPEIEIATESAQTTKKGSRSDSRGKKKVDSKQGTDVTTINEEVKPLVFEWKCVTSDGQVYRQNTTTHEYEKIDQLRLILETNPKTSEQVIHREDKVVIVFRSDGSRIVSFADGTRITSYEAMEQKHSQNDQETGEFNNSSSSFQRIPHVKIEAFGYATVAFNSQTTDCRTVFSDGSSIDVFSNGTYSVYESDGEKFDINDNGDILFDFQQSNYGKRIQELLSNIEPSKCIMSQNGDVIFDAVDYEQTQYCVESSGETYSKDNDEQQPARKFPLELHVPRFFIVHEDGSGTELLRFKDLYSYLRTMDLDPSTAVVREPLSSNPKVTGATVMRPFQDEIHRRWSTTFDDESVVPVSLRTYTADTATTDSHENSFVRQTDKCNQSGTFSTGFTNQQPILEMPKALDYRNFMEFPRLHDDIRFKLFNSLKAYIEYVTNRADYHTNLLPQDHRNRFEKEQASKIWKNARPYGTTKDDLALLYLKTVHPDKQKPATHQSVIPLAKKFNLGHLHDELRQEKANKKLKHDINRGIAVPYFQTEWGVAYTQQQNHQQGIETITVRESRSAEATKTSHKHDKLVRSPPNSPTEQQNRLLEIRKPQLNRSLSTEVAESKTMNGSDERNQDGTYRPVKPFQSPRNTVQYDAYGNQRANPVRVPNSLKGSRPNAQPHSRFLDMEEPVMVRPNNASIGAAVLNNRPLRARRGCELFPDKIDFGILKEGVTYGAEVEIKNVGIDSCRFRVRQPPLGTGLRVVFQPGVLAAGMSRPLMIELYAIIKQNYSQHQQQQQQSQGLYQLDQSIEIITETDIMHFPIRARIASEEQFDIMHVNNDGTAGMNKTIRLLARKSSNINDLYASTSKDSTNDTKE